MDLVNIFAWSHPSQLRVFVRFENSSLPRIWKMSNSVLVFNILFRFTLNKIMFTRVTVVRNKKSKFFSHRYLVEFNETNRMSHFLHLYDMVILLK